ncbi:MAG: TRAP transporter substrate-binding protein [Gammaproteobacteria bacterium]|nr:TRAP transporter substrate-binding protein [Gammaproteobacteria bacterium]
MKRRDFIAGIGSSAALTACTSGSEQQATTATNERITWRMVTTWPPNFPGQGTGVNTLARYINELSGGRMTIEVYGAGELIPAFEVFDAVSQGSVEMGHGAAYYWRGKSEATQFFASIPFGMNIHEINAWLYYGGGLELWREVYEPFNLYPIPAGNTGVQMGGWFNRQINSIEDLRGLKMRIPGVGGEVLRRAGGTPVTLPISEIFTALQTGSIDATEWVGPYNDLALGLHTAAQYYYYPGWQEPGPALECMINLDAWNTLPADLQAIVSVACQAMSLDMVSEFMARNANALEQIRESGTDIRAFPDEVLAELKRISNEVIEELAAEDPLVERVWTSYREFQTQARGWQLISEQAILNTTSL